MTRSLILLSLFALLLAPVIAEAQAEDDPPAPAGRVEKIHRYWPLFYQARQPDGLLETELLWPFLQWGSSARERYFFGAPIYYQSEDLVTQESWSLFLPAYYRSRAPRGTEFWSLPFVTRTDAASNGRTTYAPMLPIYRRYTRPGAVRERLGLPYLFDLEARNHEADGETDIDLLSLFPWGSPGHSGLPIFRYSTTATGQNRVTSIFPLFTSISGYDGLDAAEPSEKTFILWPLLYGNHTEGERRTDVFVPLLAWLNRGPEDYSWRLFLDFNGGRSPDRSWLDLEPLFSYSKSTTGGSYLFMNLYGREWDDEREITTHHVLKPLGRFQRSLAGKRDRFFPFYFAGESERASYLWLAPFYFAGERIDESSYFALAPLYYQSRRGTDVTRFVFPIYYDRILGSRRTQVGFPLFWRMKTPQNESLVLVPLYAGLKNPERSAQLFLGPTYVRRRTFEETPLKSDSILWPMFQYARRGDDWHFHALPSLWFTRRGVDRFYLAAPLYLMAKGEDYTHIWFPPVYGRYEAKQEDDTNLRIDFYGGGIATRSKVTDTAGTDLSSSVNVLGPLAGIHNDYANETFHSRVLPVWWRTKAPDSSLTMLLPAYIRKTEADRSLTLFLGNAYVDRRRGEARDRGVLWPFTRYQDSPEGSQLDILGLFSRGREGEARVRTRLTPLFAAERESDRPRNLRFNALSALHLFTRRESASETRTDVMPFLFSQRSRESSREWSALVSLLGAKTTENSRESRAIPFFFRRSTGPEDEPESSVDLFFPLYYHAMRRRGDEHTYAALFPLFSRTRIESSNITDLNLLWPIFNRSTGPNGSAGRLLPLWTYSFENDGGHAWRAGLIAAHRRRVTTRAARPLWSRDGFLDFSFVNSTAGRASSTFAVNPFLFGSHSNATTDRSEWVTLLGAAFYRRQGDSSKFNGLFLVGGEKDSMRSMWRLSPLVYSLDLNAERLPRLHPASIFHLYSRTADETESRWSLLTFLANGSRSEDGSASQFRVLHRFVTVLTDGAYRERVIQPLFTWENDADTGRSYFSLLKILYRSQRASADAETRRSILFIPF